MDVFAIYLSLFNLFIPRPSFRSVKVNVEGTVTELIQQALKKDMASAPPDNYVLRVAGREEYLLGDYKLFQYKIVRRAILRSSDKKDLNDVLVRN